MFFKKYSYHFSVVLQHVYVCVRACMLLRVCVLLAITRIPTNFTINLINI